MTPQEAADIIASYSTAPDDPTLRPDLISNPVARQNVFDRAVVRLRLYPATVGRLREAKRVLDAGEGV